MNSIKDFSLLRLNPASKRWAEPSNLMYRGEWTGLSIKSAFLSCQYSLTQGYLFLSQNIGFEGDDLRVTLISKDFQILDEIYFFHTDVVDITDNIYLTRDSKLRFVFLGKRWELSVLDASRWITPFTSLYIYPKFSLAHWLILKISCEKVACIKANRRPSNQP